MRIKYTIDDFKYKSNTKSVFSRGNKINLEETLIGKDDTINKDGGGEIFISELNWLDLNKNEEEPVKYQ